RPFSRPHPSAPRHWLRPGRGHARRRSRRQSLAAHLGAGGGIRLRLVRALLRRREQAGHVRTPVLLAGGRLPDVVPDDGGEDGRRGGADHFRFAVAFFGLTCSGSSRPPVSRFHSSNVSAEIFPFTSNSANFLRCAWLLNGISPLSGE